MNLLQVLEKVIFVGGPILGVVGAIIAIWSGARTRRRYYREFIAGREKRDDS